MGSPQELIGFMKVHIESIYPESLEEVALPDKGFARRVPTPDVSMAILNVKLTKPAGSAKELNELFLRESIDGALRRQVGYSDSPEAVSTDFVGSRTAGVVDSLATVVTDDSAIVYVWYDNEFGYSCQVIRVLERMGGYDVPSYPAK